MSSRPMLKDLHAFMLGPDFKTGADGFAPVSFIARAYGRSIGQVTKNLRRGVEEGLFVTRVRPAHSQSTNGQQVIEYKAVRPGSTGIPQGA